MRIATALVAAPLLLLLACGPREAAPAGAAAAAEPAGYLGPVLAVQAPARGAMLREGGVEPAAVPVRGQACDARHPLAALEVDGQPEAVSGAGPCLSFATAHPSRAGLTVVRGSARNDAGQEGALAHAFLRSPDYYPLSPGPEGAAESAVLLQLGPTAFDDGDRATLGDLASVAAVALGQLDLDAAVGDVHFASPDADGDGRLDTASYRCLLFQQTNLRTGFEAWKTGPATFGSVAVERLQLVAGGLAVRVAVSAPRVPVAVLGNLDSGCLGAVRLTVEGAVTARAIALEGTAAVALQGGRVAVAIPSLAAALDGLSVDVDLGAIGDLTGLGGAIGDALAAEVQGPVERAIQAALEARLADRLEQAVASLAAFQTSVTLPPALGGGTLRVDSAVDLVDFDAQRALIGVAVRLRADAPRPEHLAEAPFGAMRLHRSVPDASGLRTDAVAVGVEDDLLNQLLHAAWLSGAFDRDLGPLLQADLPGVGLTVLSHLPPVLMPLAGGAPGLELGWGELAFDLAFPTAHGSAHALGRISAILPIDRLEAGPAGLSIGFGTAVEAHVEVTRVDWGPGPPARASLTALLEGALQNLLPQALAGALRPVPLPSLDLRSLDPGLPPLGLWLATPQLSRLGSYAFLSGRLSTSP